MLKKEQKMKLYKMLNKTTKGRKKSGGPKQGQRTRAMNRKHGK